MRPVIWADASCSVPRAAAFSTTSAGPWGHPPQKPRGPEVFPSLFPFTQVFVLPRLFVLVVFTRPYLSFLTHSPLASWRGCWLFVISYLWFVSTGQYRRCDLGRFFFGMGGG